MLYCCTRKSRNSSNERNQKLIILNLKIMDGFIYISSMFCSYLGYIYENIKIWKNLK